MNIIVTEPSVTLVTITPMAEDVIESAARCCYRSTKKKVNENSTNQFLRGLIKSGHESVLEHASATFIIDDVSRALTHQLVRHRLASYTQESQRYCTNADFKTVLPETFEKYGGQALLQKVEALYDNINFMYSDMIELGIPREDARYIMPNACTTKLTMTANFREWRHIIKLRTDKHAQWEIRQLTSKILTILFDNAPNVFGDLVEV